MRELAPRVFGGRLSGGGYMDTNSCLNFKQDHKAGGTGLPLRRRANGIRISLGGATIPGDMRFRQEGTRM